LAITKTPAKTLVGGVSKNKKIRDRVDSAAGSVWKIEAPGNGLLLNVILKKFENALLLL